MKESKRKQKREREICNKMEREGEKKSERERQSE